MEDKSIFDFIAYGFPVDYTGRHIPLSTPNSHGSVNQYPENVTAYILYRQRVTTSGAFGPIPYTTTRMDCV